MKERKSPLQDLLLGLLLFVQAPLDLFYFLKSKAQGDALLGLGW